LPASPRSIASGSDLPPPVKPSARCSPKPSPRRHGNRPGHRDVLPNLGAPQHHHQTTANISHHHPPRRRASRPDPAERRT
jgi:hypothetical protein